MAQVVAFAHRWFYIRGLQSATPMLSSENKFLLVTRDNAAADEVVKTLGKSRIRDFIRKAAKSSAKVTFGARVDFNEPVVRLGASSEDTSYTDKNLAKKLFALYKTSGNDNQSKITEAALARKSLVVHRFAFSQSIIWL